MATLSKQELEAKMQTFAGQEIGPPIVGRDPVNEAMIRQWCDALDDKLPIYTDREAAEQSVHGGIVAPPMMMQAWILRGIEMADPDKMAPNKQTELHALLTENGYNGVVATNCDQGYTRYLKPGDIVSTTTVIETISDEKATGLGIGYFINTRDTFRNQDGEEVGWMTFRVLKFKREEQAAAASAETASGTPAKPRRLRAPMGYDNAWWWDAVQDEKLLIQKCGSCGVIRHPPRPMCGECQSLEWDSIESSGKGTIYSYTVIHHPKIPGYDYPSICALIELEEGTRIVSNIVDCDPKNVKIGMAVEMNIENVDEELKLPLFRPAA